MIRESTTETTVETRARKGRIAAVAILTSAALAVAAPAAMGQGDDQYQPSPPSAGGNDSPPSSGGTGTPSATPPATPSGGSGGSTASGSSSGSSGGSGGSGSTATESTTPAPPATTGAAESPTQLPATGFNALPVALLGAGLIVVGALGLRRRATS